MPSGRLALQSGSGGFFLMAMLALCFYEHLLTLNAELKYVWGRRFSGGSILFILNRYTLLVASTMAIMEDFSWVPRSGHDGRSVSSPTACNVWHRVWDVCFLLIYILYLVFAALRMYALYRSSKTVLVSVFLLGAFTPCTQGFIVFEKQPYSATNIREANTSTIQWGTTYCGHLQRLGDSTKHSGHPDWIGYALVALRAHAIIFEMILLGLTWKNTTSWEVVQNGRVRTPFTTVMFQNGTLYFIAIAIASIMQLCGLLAALSHTVHGGFLYGLELLSPVVDAIISICMSRFLLNLLAAADNSYDSEYRSSRWETILRFAQLETLGAQLRDVLDGDYEGEEGHALSEDDMMGTNHVDSHV